MLVAWCLEGRAYREIALDLGVVEARICQIVSRALANVRRVAQGLPPMDIGITARVLQAWGHRPL